MLPQHIEPRLLQEDDVALHRLLRRRRIKSVGPPALIERAVLEQRLVVEQDRGLPRDTTGPDRHFAHREIGGDAVARRALNLRLCIDAAFMVGEARVIGLAIALLFAGIGIGDRHQLGLEVIEMGIVGRPEMRVRDRQRRLPVGADDRRGDRLASRARGQPHRVGIVRPAAQCNCDVDGAAVDVGHRAHVGDMELRHRFEPHRLPDSADRGIPDARGVENLLAARLDARARRVENLDDELVRAVLQIGGDVEAEGVEAAFVRADDRAVDTHRRLIIDRAEVEHDILAAPAGGDGEAAAIPDAVVGGDPARDARQLRFDRKGHEDLAVHRRRPVGRLGGDRIIPQAVEVDPALAHHLRARVEAPCVFGRHLLAPARHQLAGVDRIVRGCGGGCSGLGLCRERREGEKGCGDQKAAHGISC